MVHFKNRKTTSTPLEKGRFTSISNFIINEAKLSPVARLLLISILSDSDDFSLVPSIYCKRLGIEVRYFRTLMEELIAGGFIKRVEVGGDRFIRGIKKSGSTKKVYEYLISAKGDLLNQPVETKDEVPSTPPVKIINEQASTKEELLKLINDNRTKSYVMGWALSKVVDEVNDGLITTKEKLFEKLEL